mmetsp:Transcript_9176/g.11404  ORF Transcript_9176/g.11404 Transcript_9176/m.11404 type:complete len:192 (-) Transcript_9176:310-885(-)
MTLNPFQLMDHVIERNVCHKARLVANILPQNRCSANIGFSCEEGIEVALQMNEGRDDETPYNAQPTSYVRSQRTVSPTENKCFFSLPDIQNGKDYINFVPKTIDRDGHETDLSSKTVSSIAAAAFSVVGINIDKDELQKLPPVYRTKMDDSISNQDISTHCDLESLKYYLTLTTTEQDQQNRQCRFPIQAE